MLKTACSIMDCQHLQIQRHSPIIHATTRSSLLHRNTACTLHVLIIWMTNTFWPIFAFFVRPWCYMCMYCNTLSVLWTNIEACGQSVQDQEWFCAVSRTGPSCLDVRISRPQHCILCWDERVSSSWRVTFYPASPPRAKQHILFLHCVAKKTDSYD